MRLERKKLMQTLRDKSVSPVHVTTKLFAKKLRISVSELMILPVIVIEFTEMLEFGFIFDMTDR